MEKTFHCSENQLTQCIFNSSSSEFLTSGFDGKVILWNRYTGEVIDTIKGHELPVYSIAFNSPYDDKIATSSIDKTGKIWDAKTRKCLYTLNHKLEVLKVTFSHDGKMLATSCADGSSTIWNVNTGEKLQNFKQHSQEVVNSIFNNDNSNLLSYSYDGTAKIFNIGTGQLIANFKEHSGEISSCQFNPVDNNMIITGSFDKTLKIWDLRKPDKSIKTFTDSKGELNQIIFDSLGKKIAAAGSDGEIYVYSSSTLTKDKELSGHHSDVLSIMFNRNKEPLLVSGGSDGTCKLWDVNKGNCVETLEETNTEIFSCSFNAKGDSIITANMDNICKVWTRIIPVNP